eukprot:scaffold1251_cov333-Pavlova_lutheri.AAC.6
MVFTDLLMHEIPLFSTSLGDLLSTSKQHEWFLSHSIHAPSVATSRSPSFSSNFQVRACEVHVHVWEGAGGRVSTIEETRSLTLLPGEFLLDKAGCFGVHGEGGRGENESIPCMSAMGRECGCFDGVEADCAARKAT